MIKDNERLSLLLVKARESSTSFIRPILSDHDMTEQQWRVIRALYVSYRLNAKQLADQSGILGPSLSRILKHLISKGIIISKRDGMDKRAQSIRLSYKGKRLHDKMQPLLEKQYEDHTEAVGSGTINALLTLLDKYSRRYRCAS